MKNKETLEEAGLKHCELIDNFPALENPLFSFKEGAKWQQERMYSENDLKEAFKQSRRTNIFEIGMPLVFDSFEDWFKQYKK